MSMSVHRDEALQTWREQVSDMYLDCSGGDAADEADCLRRLCKLLNDAPAMSRHLIGVDPDVRRVDGLLAAGAHESAALALLGDASGYMISRGANGVFLASVILPAMEEEVSQSGPTLAMALAAALLLAIVHLLDHPGHRAMRASGAAMQLRN